MEGAAPSCISRGNWVACDRCYPLIQQDAWDQLLTVALAQFKRTYGRPTQTPSSEILEAWRRFRANCTGEPWQTNK